MSNMGIHARKELGLQLDFEESIGKQKRGVLEALLRESATAVDSGVEVFRMIKGANNRQAIPNPLKHWRGQHMNSPLDILEPE